MDRELIHGLNRAVRRKHRIPVRQMLSACWEIGLAHRFAHLKPL